MRRVPPSRCRDVGAGVTALAGEPDVWGNWGRDHDPLEMVVDSSISTDSSVRAPREPAATYGPGPRGLPMAGGSMTGPGSLGPSHPSARSSWGHQNSPSPGHWAPHWGWGWNGWCWARTWTCGWAQLSGAMAGQGKAVGCWRPALLRGLMAPGADMESWAVSRWGEPQGARQRPVRAGGWCPQGPDNMKLLLRSVHRKGCHSEEETLTLDATERRKPGAGVCFSSPWGTKSLYLPKALCLNRACKGYR